MKLKHFIPKISIWIAPVLLSLFPTLSIYTHNLSEIDTNRIIIPIIYSLIFTAISICVFLVIFKNKQKAAIFTSLWVFLFFSYGYFYLQLASGQVLTISNSLFLPFSINKIMLGLYTVTLILFGIFLYRQKQSPTKIVLVFNLIAAVLVTYNLIIIFPYCLKSFKNSDNIKKSIAENIKLENEINYDLDEVVRPDIYYIIFDRYGRQDVLKEYFNYDNQSIITYLRENGFFVADQSNANYPHTFLSLSSSLNMSYLDFLPSILKQSDNRLIVTDNLIKNNEVVRFLKENLGYQYILLGSYWDPTKSSPMADSTANLFIDFDEFQLYIYEKTLANTLRGLVESNQLFTGVEKLNHMVLNVNYRLDELKKSISSPMPKFVFGHFLIPHDPNIFSDRCLPFDFSQVTNAIPENYYLQELQCANFIMRQIIEEIAVHSSRPAVIIFQSDEGPALPNQYFDKEGAFLTTDKDALIIHSGILNSVYIPSKENPNMPADYQSLGLNSGTTPVNIFRAILNYYFATDTPLLEDKTFIYPNPKKPYVWENITDILKK